MGQVETLDDVKNDIQNDNLIDEKRENAMREYLRSKMESVQKRIDELKKAKEESEQFQNADVLIKLEDSFYDLNNEKESINNRNSNKSLCVSLSSNSLSSFNSSLYSYHSSYSNYCLTKFIGNLGQNEDQHERSSLLKLHSKKLISHNLMKHSLADLAKRCEEERIVIERCLDRLRILAKEFNFNIKDENNNKDNTLKARENCDISSDQESYLTWPPKIIELPENTDVQI